MSIYKSAINKPITTLLIFVAVIILGLFSLNKLPIDQYPEMEPPYISVMTTYAGANGSEIETNVTKLLENNLNSVDGLKEITSTSKDNMSLITLEFQWGEDMDEAVNDIRNALEWVKDELPEGASTPIIFKFNTSMMPIMQYAITADESYPGLDKILNDKVINVLNRIDGIGNLSLSGAPDRYIYIDLDPNKIDAYNISLEQVGQAISNNNLNLASGSVKMGREQYQLRVEGEYKSSEEINNVVVASMPDGRKVFVRDLAVVRDTIKDLTLDEKINGRDGVRLVIMKQTGANTVQIASDVRKEMEKIQKTLPPDIKMEIIYDGSEFIENAISGLSETVIYALIFVVLVVLFFLGKWRATIIIGVTIPISLVVSFIYLLFTDSSLNMISLSSLNIAIGMVVDDAIVVLENIDKHISRGASPREAAIYATNEVWVSVIATTLVIVAVFVPLTTLSGMAGIIFRELGWIVTIVVCTSTLVAITLTPMLSSKLLKARTLILDKTKEKIKKRRITYQNTVVKALDKIDAFYANALRACLTHKTITIITVVAIFILSLLPMFLGFIGTDFMAENDQGRMSITVELQRGTRVEESMKVARDIEARIFALYPKDVRIISSTTGSNDDAGISALFSSATNNKISMTIRTTKMYERDFTIFEMAENIRKEFDKMPEVINYTVSTSNGGGAGGNNTVDVEVYGYDFDKTNAFVAELKQRLKSVEGARDINVSREEDRAELQIIFDKEKLALHGLSEAMVASYIRSRVNGMNAGYLKEDGEEYDIVVRLQEDYRNTISKLEEFTLNTPAGEQIKLKEIADIKEYWCPPNIERKRRERVCTVTARPVDISLGELATNIQAEIDKMEVPQEILVTIGGTYEEQQETFSDMILLFLLIVLLVYVVMASQFESFSKPFIIMMSIPFAVSGVILALLITGITLNVVGALGVILLVGIVVKNGIVLVDYINLMRDRGYELNEAIALSGQSRLRPVLMTAMTTILGMVPMVLSTSEGSETWVPMGVVVIGGLLVSTMITLIVVPVLYAIFSRHGERDNAEKIRKTFIFFDMPDDVVIDSRVDFKNNDEE
ncbi:MAG: efflux RND transporter permease subunit [Bacteroidales bacterium]|nr:efflux RND transporter permease subunit [Bacteroidales bacterium]